MKTLKYALLGQIMLGPKSGYDLMQIFGSSYSHAWYASHSQIYPELKRLTTEGLIEFDTEIQGKVLEKKIYTVTEKGREEFHNWMLHDAELNSSPKDEFRLKLMYLSCLSKEEVLAKIKKQKKLRQDRMAKTKESIAKYDANTTDLEELGNYLNLKGALLREQSYLDWLDICAERIGTLSE